MAGSAMDRVFGAVSSAVNKFTGNGNPDPSQGNNTIPGPGNNVQSDGSVKAIPAAATGTESPLANYTDLFKNDPEKPTAVGPINPMPQFTLDQTKISEAAAKMDFTADISSAELATLYPGVDEAAARSALNKVGARGFVANFTAGGQALETAMSRQTNDFMTKTIPEIVRRENTQMLTRDLGYANDPMTAPVFNMLKEQFTNKHPDATPAQIADHTQKYMTEMFKSGAKLNGQEIRNTPRQPKGATDWDDFIEEPSGASAIFQ